MALVPGKVSHPKAGCQGYASPPKESDAEDTFLRPEGRQIVRGN